MGSKYSRGQMVMVLKSVYFHEEDQVIRSGEVGRIIDIESIAIDNSGNMVYDYIVCIGKKILFFFEEELASYPNRGQKCV
jgi:hypothetical protein